MTRPRMGVTRVEGNPWWGAGWVVNLKSLSRVFCHFFFDSPVFSALSVALPFANWSVIDGCESEMVAEPAVP